MRLFLIRHGETDWNRQHLLQGNRDIPLNEAGIQLAMQTAEGLRRAGLTFDRIYSSPLQRARHTAQLLCPNQPLILDDRLRELSFGAYEGTVCPALADLPLAAPGGETVAALQARVMACLQEIAADPVNQGGRILVSTHGAAIRSVRMALKGLPLTGFWQGGVSPNCSVTVLRAEGARLVLEQENVVYRVEETFWLNSTGSN